MTDIVIYHNPECGTSRNALAMIRNAGIEPHVIEYLKTPPARALLESLIVRAGVAPRALLREKGTPFAELGLDNPDLTDAQLIDAARHRRWLSALVKMAQETPGNLELMQGWIAKWEPLADKAIDAYCSALPDVADAAASAKAATREFRRSLGL